MPVTPGILESMRYITMADSKRFLSFEASDETLERLAQITETYLTTQLERGFSTLDFYKSLLLPL
jgi:DNA repair protein RecO (recombination protein O)